SAKNEEASDDAQLLNFRSANRASCSLGIFVSLGMSNGLSHPKRAQPSGGALDRLT
ncbi:hypothetical protein OS493_027032, partial [Desmophyllum pertusum]